jgi:hypothetical protein
MGVAKSAMAMALAMAMAMALALAMAMAEGMVKAATMGTVMEILLAEGGAMALAMAKNCHFALGCAYQGINAWRTSMKY